MAKKKATMPTSLKIGLYDPGMTPLHRAGLGGLAASLLSLKVSDYPGQWDVQETYVELTWEEGKANEFFEKLLSEGLAIQDPKSIGIIDFPAFKNRLGHSASYEARLAYQDALMGTFLQHGKSRTLGSEKVLVLDPEAQKRQRSYRPMESFKHQQQAKDIVGALSPKGTNDIRIAGWAYPGAVEKHPGKSWSRMEVSVGAFVALCFAPVGTFSFKVVSNIDRKRRAYALVVPVVSDLKRFGRFRRRFAKFDASQMYVSSASDAGLMIAAAMHSGFEFASRQRQEFLQVMTLGTQPWASQQKTRTKVMYINEPDERTLSLYRFVMGLAQFQPKKIQGKNGYFYAISPVREAITEALAEGVPWYESVIDTYTSADSELRNRFHQYEQGGLSAMIEYPESLSQREKLFVEVCHKAMGQLYWSVRERGEAQGTNVDRKLEVELTKIRSSLLRAKNEDTLRDALVDFWAKASRDKVQQNSVLGRTIKVQNKSGEVLEMSGWEVILPMLEDQNWKKARQLALIALLSRSTRSSSDGDEEDLSEEE